MIATVTPFYCPMCNCCNKPHNFLQNKQESIYTCFFENETLTEGVRNETDSGEIARSTRSAIFSILEFYLKRLVEGVVQAKIRQNT